MPYETAFGFDEPAPIFVPPPVADVADQIARLRLIRSRRVGAVTFHRLLAEHGSAAAALAALPEVARGAGVDQYAPCPEDVVRHEIAQAHAAGARMVCHGEAAYPAHLADLADAPADRARVRAGTAEVAFRDYDWALNDARQA